MYMPDTPSHDEQRIQIALSAITDRLLPLIHPDRIQEDLSQPGASIDLFNGKAGMICFYLRLADYQPAYRAACIAAADTLLFHPAVFQQSYYTLYTGATGLLYLCVQLYEVTNDALYLHRAGELTARFQEGILQEVIQDDFISGHAGNLLVLTQLYGYTKDNEILLLIRQLADKLLSNARIAKQGLRWGHFKGSYDCLTGFSHGASGIAHALLQVAGYFRDEGLEYLAMEAWRYEMTYHDPARNNWLDLRLTSTRLQDADIMDWELTRFQQYISDVNSWAHGAAGIGLANLYAWRQTGQAHFGTAVTAALERCMADANNLSRGDYTLCSGYGGIALFLLQAAEILKKPDLRDMAKQLAVAAVNYFEKHGTYNSFISGSVNDPGLFSGMAGVGYLFASVLLPPRSNDIIVPCICVPAHDSPLYAAGAVKRQLFSRYYERSLAIADPAAVDMANDVHQLEALLRPTLYREDCFIYEQSLTNVWRYHRGLLYYTQRGALLERINSVYLSAPDTALLEYTFAPVQGLESCSVADTWNLAADVTGADNNGTSRSYYLHYAHAQGVSTFPVSRFTALLLEALQRSATLAIIIQTVLYPQVDVPLEALQAAVVSQIRVLLRQGLITAR
ncbi:lanthionine synthetase LanC family protein [Chitinophaga rhizophila]|uniref:Lanthionine synthetase-like protein n=1 Tax=Chitinophaga rhizophila TaxID=2866212 RepID=A0ABS7G5P2_9BACT|nr:lanthionine synthetase LanC family protein [Chitinophaga rhizophila]MBW8682960.1 hypothetical protein [Chitinophaga rhizophila]